MSKLCTVEQLKQSDSVAPQSLMQQIKMRPFDRPYWTENLCTSNRHFGKYTFIIRETNFQVSILINMILYSFFLYIDFWFWVVLTLANSNTFYFWHFQIIFQFRHLHDWAKQYYDTFRSWYKKDFRFGLKKGFWHFRFIQCKVQLI